MEKWRFLGRFQVDNEAYFLTARERVGLPMPLDSLSLDG
jgi:hypothetical protein